MDHQEWMDMQRRRVERIKAVACPTCDAPKGSACINKRGGARRSLHSARDDLFLGRPARTRRKLVQAKYPPR